MLFDRWERELRPFGQNHLFTKWYLRQRRFAQDLDRFLFLDKTYLRYTCAVDGVVFHESV